MQAMAFRQLPAGLCMIEIKIRKYVSREKIGPDATLPAAPPPDDASASSS